MPTKPQPPAPVTLKAFPPDHPQRAEMEHHIRHGFSSAFDARVEAFMPTLLALVDAQGMALAVCGIRSAGLETLYLEHYLARPVEQMLSEVQGRPIDRARMVEIGQLAALRHGHARMLFHHLIHYLVAEGFDWCVFTATGPLAAMLKHQGFQAQVFCPARADCIEDAQRLWGRYYEHAPRVCCGDLRAAQALISDGAKALRRQG